MAFEEVKSVLIGENGGYKFIVVELVQGDERKVVVRATDLAQYHAGIFSRTLWRRYHARDCAGNLSKREEELCRECSCNCAIQLKCLGGGRIHLDRVNKTIHIWDRSTGYGLEPDRETRTVGLLQEAYPEFEVICGKPDGIRD